MAPQTTKGLDFTKPIGSAPGRLDVVSFRGGRTNNHYGSKMWRSRCDDRKLDYLHAKTQKEKRAIVLDCIREHELRGGRYVGEYQGKYYLNTPEKAYQKTIQRLREGNSKKFLRKIEKMVLPPAPVDANITETETLTIQDMAELCELFMTPPQDDANDQQLQDVAFPLCFHPIDGVESEAGVLFKGSSLYRDPVPVSDEDSESESSGSEYEDEH